MEFIDPRIVDFVRRSRTVIINQYTDRDGYHVIGYTNREYMGIVSGSAVMIELGRELSIIHYSTEYTPVFNELAHIYHEGSGELMDLVGHLNQQLANDKIQPVTVEALIECDFDPYRMIATTIQFNSSINYR